MYESKEAQNNLLPIGSIRILLEKIALADQDIIGDMYVYVIIF
jgi:hypothetical protein